MAFRTSTMLRCRRTDDFMEFTPSRNRMIVVADVNEYFRRKASDYDRWLRGMRRQQASVTPHSPS